MTTIYLGNLPFSATEADVRTLFEQHGTVQSVKLVNDLGTITAEVRSDRSGTCLHAGASVDLSSKTSWVASVLTDRYSKRDVIAVASQNR